MRTAIALLTAFLSLQAQSTSRHSLAFWRSIAEHQYAVPEDSSSAELAHELSSNLGSPDPVLRDDTAYSILARWIGRGMLPAETLTGLTDEWEANLKKSKPDSSVLLRSFSALCLASMAKRENRSPFMGAARYHELVDAAVAYLVSERDLRGWDAELGWIHATAHTSDLLEALAENPQMTNDEERKVIEAIATRIATAPHVYTQGEQDRMAAALAAVLRRSGINAGPFDRWLTAIDTSGKEMWKHPLTSASLAAYQNQTYTLQALTVHLMNDPETPASSAFRAKVLALLKQR